MSGRHRHSRPSQTCYTLAIMALSILHVLLIITSNLSGCEPGLGTKGNELTVTAISPGPRSVNVEYDSTISITFDRPVDPSSFDSDEFWAFGKWSGVAAGTLSFSNANQTVTLTPTNSFSAGEQVMVILSHNLQAADGSFLRDAGVSFQFFVKAEPQSALDLQEIDSMTTRTTQNESTRSYGGIATDLNEDGWLDITVVNEDTADLRTFLNRADNTGLFEDFLEPPAPVNERASPSEPTDFNRDGHADICVVNIDTDSVSVLFGNGDGTFSPQQEINVGDAPRGIAVLDADGDGDIDIVNTNSGSGNVSIMINDGSGVFGSPTFFEGGGIGEWALAAADMDNDNVLDLVIGALSGETIVVNQGNGDGTFSFVSSRDSGGRTWMLVCGDLDGDGNEDVTCANSGNNNGSVLMGNGNGTFDPASTYSTDPFPLATDVADLDGDGDLDWVTASFSGDWRIFRNDGTGSFTFEREVNAPIAASCSLAMDIDNDRDLDLALIDELADVVIIMRNGGYTAVPNSVAAFRGLYLSGSDIDTQLSDDRYLKYNPGIVLMPAEPPVSLIFDSTLSSDQPAELIFRVEASVNTTGISQTIEIWNWTTSQYDNLDSIGSSLNVDSIQEINLSGDIANYVQPGTRNVRAKVSWRATGLIFLNPWTVCIDQVAWTEQ